MVLLFMLEVSNEMNYIYECDLVTCINLSSVYLSVLIFNLFELLYYN